MPRKIKIIQIIPTLDIGGAERLMVDLVKGLDKDFYEIEVICLKRFGVWGLKLKELGVKMFLVGQKRKISPIGFIKLASILKREKPDLVHTHLFGADIYGKLAAKLAGVKHIISTEHNINRSEGRIKKMAKKFVFKYNEMSVAVSQAVKDYMIEYEGAAAGKIKVIYNGAIIENFLNQPSGNGEKDKITIGAVGRLTRQKNFSGLITAISLIKNNKIECLIAGDGELKKDLQKQIKDLNLDDKVKLIGQRKDIGVFLSSLDIFVMPSLWEGFGIAVLEAGAAGLPVIASAVDSLKEIIEHNKTGILVEPANENELSEKITYLLNNKIERERLGGNLREKVISNFSLEKMVQEYDKLYKSLTGYARFIDK